MGPLAPPSERQNVVYGSSAGPVSPNATPEERAKARYYELYAHLKNQGYSEAAARTSAATAYYDINPSGSAPQEPVSVTTPSAVTPTTIPQEPMWKQLSRQVVRPEAKALSAESSGLTWESELLKRDISTHQQKYMYETGGKWYYRGDLSPAEIGRAEAEGKMLESRSSNINQQISRYETARQAYIQTEQQQAKLRGEYASGRMTTQEAIQRGVVPEPKTGTEKFAVGTQILREKIFGKLTGSTGREQLAVIGGQYRPTGVSAGVPEISTGMIPSRAERRYMAASFVSGAVTTPLSMASLALEPMKAPSAVVESLKTVSRRVQYEPAYLGYEILGGTTSVNAIASTTLPTAKAALKEANALKSAGKISVGYAKYYLKENILPKQPSFEYVVPSVQTRLSGYTVVGPETPLAKIPESTPLTGSITPFRESQFTKGQTTITSYPIDIKPPLSFTARQTFAKFLKSERGAIAIPTQIQLPRVQVIPGARLQVTSTPPAVTPSFGVESAAFSLREPYEPQITERGEYPSLVGIRVPRAVEVYRPALPQELKRFPEQIPSTRQLLEQPSMRETVPFFAQTPVIGTTPISIQPLKPIQRQKLVREPYPREEVASFADIQEARKMEYEELRKRGGGFDVYAKVKGEFVPLGKNLQFEKATFAGAEYASKTSARSFKVVPAGALRTTKGIKLGVPGFYEKGGTLIERTKFAINTPGEFREITMKGIAAKKFKKAKRFKL